MTPARATRLAFASLVLALGVCLLVGGSAVAAFFFAANRPGDAIGAASGAGAVGVAFVVSWPVMALTLGQGGLYPFYGYVASAILRVVVAVVVVLIAVWLGKTPAIATLMTMAGLYLLALFAELAVVYRGLVQAAETSEQDAAEGS